jgi:hypothetical protein
MVLGNVSLSSLSATAPCVVVLTPDKAACSWSSCLQVCTYDTKIQDMITTCGAAKLGIQRLFPGTAGDSRVGFPLVSATGTCQCQHTAFKFTSST